MLELGIEASLLPKQRKALVLKKLRVKMEIMKQMIRLANELKIYSDSVYLSLQEKLQEISKMTNGWLKYLKQNPE